MDTHGIAKQLIAEHAQTFPEVLRVSASRACYLASEIGLLEVENCSLGAALEIWGLMEAVRKGLWPPELRV
jgi:hypothetical protein